MIKKSQKKLISRKSNRLAFTLIECLIFGVLLCSFVWSMDSIKNMYNAMLLASTTDYVAAACHYLAHCAQAREVSTAFYISSNNTYSTDDGKERRDYRLPGGVLWGPCAKVKGPPSRPTTVVTDALVGGEIDERGVCLKWYKTGAYTPGTLYLHRGDTCSAISLPRAVYGVLRRYFWREQLWTMRDE